MIILTNQQGQSLDLGTIKDFGVVWGGTIDNFKSKNSFVKIPGGKNLDYGSDHDTIARQITLVTNKIDLDHLNAAKSRILKHCTDSMGNATEMSAFFKPFNGFMRIKISAVSTEVGIDFLKINIDFDFIEQFIYSEEKTITKNTFTLSNTPTTIATKNDHYGAFADITITGANLRGVELTTIDDVNNRYTISLGNINTSAKFNNEKFSITIDGVEKYIHVHSKFRFYKTLTLKGTGTVSNVTIKYREVWL